MIVYIEGRKITIKEPLLATLKKYGLSLDNWKELLRTQGYRCPVCKRILEKRINIDHNHVRGWRKMTDENRKKHVRGLLCFFCNKYYVGKAITVEKSENVTAYLKRHERKVQNDRPC